MKCNHLKIIFVFLLSGIFLLSGCIKKNIETEQSTINESKVSDSILNSIDKTYKCDSDSDCVVYEMGCISGSCWNKNNLPVGRTQGNNEGACAPPRGVSGCVCEKNRCQPNLNERDDVTFHFQSCKTNLNCFSDEICLDSNTMSSALPGYEYTLKKNDAENKVCYTKCETDADCSTSMICSYTKLVPSKVWNELAVRTSAWENNPDLLKAEIIRYCIFSY